MKLLTTGNAKTVKGESKGYLTFILHLAPANLSGYEVCPKRSPGCTAGCLNTAGRGGMFTAAQGTNAIQQARIRKTRYFFEDREQFMRDLALDIAAAIKSAARKGMTAVFRLNGTSDLSWEKYRIDGKNLFELFPHAQFYDYTKVLGRKVAQYPNYHLTFSRSESNERDCERALAQGMNLAVVYDSVPEWRYTADDTDLRFLDPSVGIIGLRAKGRARKDTSGFVVRSEVRPEIRAQL